MQSPRNTSGAMTTRRIKQPRSQTHEKTLTLNLVLNLSLANLLVHETPDDVISELLVLEALVDHEILRTEEGIASGTKADSDNA